MQPFYFFITTDEVILKVNQKKTQFNNNEIKKPLSSSYSALFLHVTFVLRHRYVLLYTRKL